jgi:phage I-like protein
VSLNPETLGVMSAEIKTLEDEFQLLPEGAFRANDGRPANAPHYVLAKAHGEALIAAFKGRGQDMVVDYEHQTLLTQENGRPARAAGWIRDLEWRPGKGLFATRVKWTEAARAAIKADEYRYISPVFIYEPGSGVITRLYNAALTNTPALDGMATVVAHSVGVRELEALRQETETARSELARLEAARQAAQAAEEEDKARRALEEIERVMTGYMKAGKLAPAEAEIFRKLAHYDIAALRQLLDYRVTFFGCQTGKMGFIPPGSTSAHLTPADIRACELTGRSRQEFAALKTRFFNDDPASAHVY